MEKMKEQTNEVWRIGDTGETQENQVMVDRELMVEKGVQHDTRDSAEEGKSQPKYKKGWRRKDGRGSGKKLEGVFVVGTKRNDREINEMGPGYGDGGNACAQKDWFRQCECYGGWKR